MNKRLIRDLTSTNHSFIKNTLLTFEGQTYDVLLKYIMLVFWKSFYLNEVNIDGLSLNPKYWLHLKLLLCYHFFQSGESVEALYGQMPMNTVADETVYMHCMMRLVGFNYLSVTYLL